MKNTRNFPGVAQYSLTLPLLVLTAAGAQAQFSPLISTTMVGQNGFSSGSAGEYADVNGDGIADLVVRVQIQGTSQSTVGWHFGIGDGTYGTFHPISIPGDVHVIDFALSDLDGDGDLDLAATVFRPFVGLT